VKHTPQQHPPRLLRLPEVKARIGLQTTQIYEYMARGDFPKSVKLCPSGRAVGWLESEVNAWIEARIAEREAVAG
jgi:prophage regulatory protein